jgi:hypothetical protein
MSAMKKIFSNVTSKWFWGTGLIVLTVISCQKHFNSDFSLPRQFKPGDINIDARETEAILTWVRSQFTTGKDVTYTVEVSQDSTFQGTIVDSKTVSTPSDTLTDDVLQPRQNYYARVKANALGTTAESGWVVSAAFMITGEQIFEPVQPSDIIDIAVILKWRATPGLTKIVVTPSGGSPVEVTLDANDIAAGQKIVNGLTPATMYTAEIFAGTKSKGITSFTTQATVAGSNIIDLRNSSDPLVLVDTLPQIADGSIVLLQRGMVYDIPTGYTFDRSVTIMSGLGFGAQAVLSLGSNFDASGNIDSLNFYDVTIANNGTSYFMNVGNVAVIGRIDIENCVTQGVYSNSFIRLKTSGDVINKLYINNCIIDSFGISAKYAVLYANASSNAKIDDIEIHNSTFYSLYYFVRQDGVSTSSLVIDNCTFNDLINQGGYFVRYSGSFPPTFQISNCIFGKTGDPANSNGTAGTPNVSNSYSTSDFVLTSNPISGLTAYSGASTDLFADPANGDFSIKDSNFAGRNSAGDPRWR